jgi:hypothetical protein
VSNDPTGPSAISAVRFTLQNSEGFPTLSLRVARFTAQPATAATPDAAPIRACVVTADWTTPTTFPGPWSARPSYDCTKGSTPGQLSPDLSTMVFDLTVLPAGRSYDLALVPGAPVPPVPEPTFDVTFEPVKPSDLAVFPTSPKPGTKPAPAADTAVGPAPLGSFEVPAAPRVVPAPSAAEPTAVVSTTPRALVGPLAKVAGTSSAVRVMAGVVFGALALWAWRLLAANNATGIVVADGRRALRLSDPAPFATEPEPRRRFAAGPRTGAPPALR